MNEVKHYGRYYKVLAQFPESDHQAANAYMAANPRAAVLCIQAGIVYLVGKNAAGVAA